LPEFVISASTTDSFKNKLDKFWSNQDLVYSYKAKLTVIPGTDRGGPEARPVAAIVNLPVCARTRLPLTSAQFIKLTEVRHEKA